MKEIRRRTRVIGAFPDGYSALMLAGARLRHISSTKWETRQYMNNGTPAQFGPAPPELFVGPELLRLRPVQRLSP